MTSRLVVNNIDNDTGVTTIRLNPTYSSFELNSAERLRITSAGKVGIGIDPTARLHVNGVSTDGNIILARCADSNGLSSLNLLVEGTSGNSRILFSDTAAPTGDGWISYSHSDRALTFTTAGTSNERLRIDASGRFIIGHTAALNEFHGPYGTTNRNPQFQINGTNISNASMSITSWDNNVVGYYGAGIFLARSGSSTKGTNSRVTNNNTILGSIIFSGDDGTDFVKGAMIQAAVEGSTGDNDMPARLQFLTTPDGAQEPIERLRIKSDGEVSMALLSSLITNGDFSNGTANWTASGGSIAVSSGVLTLTPNAGVNGFAYQAITTVAGKHYNVQVDVTQDAASYSRLYVGTSATGSQTIWNINLGVGTHSFTFKATATTHYISLVVGGGTQQATKFDNVRVIESNAITFSTPTGTSPSIRSSAFNGLALTTGGTDKLTITSAGYIKTPNQPVFMAYRVSNYDITTTPTAMVYTEEEIDVGGNYDPSNGKFTAPVDGLYEFGYASIASATATVYRYDLRINGSIPYSGMRQELRLDQNQSAGEYGTNGEFCLYINMTAGQYAQVYVHADTAVNNAYGSAQYGYTYFRGRLIG